MTNERRSTISVNESTLKKLKLLSAVIDKPLYELIDEATELLKVKYDQQTKAALFSP